MNLKEEYNCVKILEEALKYDASSKEIIDFRMVSFQIGLQEGFTKFTMLTLRMW